VPGLGGASKRGRDAPLLDRQTPVVEERAPASVSKPPERASVRTLGIVTGSRDASSGPSSLGAEPTLLDRQDAAAGG
jgi:hypothetical protein